MKKVLSLLLVMTLIASFFVCVPVSAASEETPPTGIITGDSEQILHVDFSKFKDVGNHWAKDYLKWGVDNGLLAGTSATTLSPNGNITRAQMATIITRAFGATKEADISMFVDVPKDMWCYSAVAKAVQMGCLSGFGNALAPNQNVTRQEVAVTLVKAAGYITGSEYSLAGYKDYSKIDSWARPYMAAAVDNGIMNGYTNGNLGPKDLVTRAQFVAMMQRVAKGYMTPTATYTAKTVDGSLMVGIGNISLDNMTISKNLFLTDGTGTGSIKLSGTSVGGTVYVRGTGPNTVELSDYSHVNNVVLCNPNNAVRLLVNSGCSVANVTVLDANGSVTLTGSVGDVNIVTGKAPVKFAAAIADDVVISGKMAAVTIDKSSSVSDIVVMANAVGADLDMSGSARSLDVNAANSTVNIKGSIASLSFGNTGDSCKLTIAKESTIKKLDLDTDDLKLTLAGKMTTVNLSGDDCDISFGSGSVVTTLNISGDDNEVTFDSGSQVSKVYTSGDDLVLDGRGTVKKIQVDKGKNVKITVPNAEVYNKGGSSVYAGDDGVSRGETVNLNSTGLTTTQAEAAKKNNANNSNTSGGSGNSGSGSSNSGSGSGSSNSGSGSGNSGSGSGSGSGNSGSGSGSNNSGGSSNTTSPNISLSLATEGYPSDFGYESAYSYGDFGQGLAYNSITGKITGTAKYISGFKWYTLDSSRAQYATGYYVPFALTSDITSSAGELKVGDASFDSSCISEGTAYNGRWMVYVYIDPKAASKTVTVSYDPDGAETAFGASELTLDFSELEFSSGPAAATMYDDVTAIPGVDGAETATLTKTAPAVDSGIDHQYQLATENLLETRNEHGRYGYWTGIRIPSYSDCKYGVLRGTDASGNSFDSTYGVQKGTINGTEMSYVEFAFNANTKNLGEKLGYLSFDLIWYTDISTPSDHPSVKIKVDISSCKLAGESTSGVMTPVSEMLSISAVTDAELATYGSIANFVADYRISGSVLGGTVLKVETTANYAAGYYYPVKVTTANIAENASLVCSDSENALGAIDAGESGSIIALVPLTLQGSNVQDVKLTLKPTANSLTHSAVSATLDCSSLGILDEGLVASTTAPEGASAYVQGLSISDFHGFVSIEGTYKKISDASSVGFEASGAVWVAPLDALVYTSQEAYTIKYTDAVGEHTISSSNVTDGKVNFKFAVAHEHTEVSGVTVELFDSSDELLYTMFVSFYGTRQE